MSKHAFDTADISFQTTHHVRDTCLCLNAQRAARVLARRFDEAFRPLGLTSGQFSLLMALNRPQPPSINEVATLLVMDRTTLTAALKPLVRRALLLVSADPKDRRGRRLRLTETGKDLLCAALPVWRDVHRRIEARDPGVGDLPEKMRTVVSAAR